MSAREIELIVILTEGDFVRHPIGYQINHLFVKAQPIIMFSWAKISLSRQSN